MKTTQRYRHLSRSIIENISKLALISGIGFTIGTHVYMALLLAISEIPGELIWPSLIFDIFLGTGIYGLILVGGKGQRGPFIEWLAYFIPALFCIYFWNWQYEMLDTFGLGFSYFPIPSVIVLIWICLILFSAIYVIGVGIAAIVKLAQRKIKITLHSDRNNRIKSIIYAIIPLALLGLAPLITFIYINEGSVKNTITIVDTNHDCYLSMWDAPDITAQVGTSQDINLSLLTLAENRTLNAFRLMNTTFYFGPGRNNGTIARLKTLAAFNLSVCWTIWYTGINEFPGPAKANEWVTNARAVIKFVRDNNLRNVIGICADSESSADVSPDEYWSYINIYDMFLNEVQNNVSLHHPDPARGRFKTVLCYGGNALIDLIDGDNDIVVLRRELGLPPSSWTDYHFMLYRGGESDNPAWLHNYLMLAKNYLGTDIAAPIVGITGVDWFSEGYFAGSNNAHSYDGIDGWRAMKREILYAKALGFNTVSVFHLNAYNSPNDYERRGFLDYYGIEAAEELAADWNANTVVQYPISSLEFELDRQGYFNPNALLQYDLMTNVEMVVIQFLIFASIAGSIIITIINFQKFQKMKNEERNR